MVKFNSLIKKLDAAFSLYIRQRDSNEEGYGKCITCPTIKHYKEMDNGHFISRAEYGIRWDEKNCALQCKKCNGFRGGEQHLFAIEIDKKWGKGTAETLQVKRHFSKKLDRFELEQLIRYYKERVK